MQTTAVTAPQTMLCVLQTAKEWAQQLGAELLAELSAQAVSMQHDANERHCTWSLFRTAGAKCATHLSRALQNSIRTSSSGNWVSPCC